MIVLDFRARLNLFSEKLQKEALNAIQDCSSRGAAITSFIDELGLGKYILLVDTKWKCIYSKTSQITKELAFELKRDVKRYALLRAKMDELIAPDI